MINLASSSLKDLIYVKQQRKKFCLRDFFLQQHRFIAHLILIARNSEMLMKLSESFLRVSCCNKSLLYALDPHYLCRFTKIITLLLLLFFFPPSRLDRSSNKTILMGSIKTRERGEEGKLLLIHKNNILIGIAFRTINNSFDEIMEIKAH